MATRDEIDVHRFARLYAQRVLRNSNMDPSDMPELARNATFRALKAVGRADISRSIRRVAGEILITAGFTSAQVNTVLKLEHRWEPELHGKTKQKERRR